MEGLKRLASASLVGAIAIVLAVGAGACGGSEDGEDGAADRGGAREAPPDGTGADDDDADGGAGADGAAAGRSADEREAVRVMREMGARMEAGDYAGVCELMATAAMEQLVAGSGERGGGRGGDSVQRCADMLAEMFGDGVDENLDPPVTSVEVSGDRAVVTAKPSKDEPPQRARLRREGGEWRVVTFYTN